MNTVIKICGFGVLFLAMSCQSKAPKVEAVSPEKMAGEISRSISSEPAAREHPGKAVYTRYCLACHQADGSGVPNMHPPLTPGSWVGKNPEELISILLKGLNGKIEVNGDTYKNFMPSHAQLTDEEIANVLSYVRTGFGNQFEPVTEAMVKKVRNGN